MGRPKKYHTAEEKRAADALKSKRYYNKNRGKVTCRMRRQYSKKCHASTSIPPVSTKDTSASSLPSGSTAKENTDIAVARNRSVPAQFWMKAAREIPERFQRMLGGKTTVDFMNELCSQFIKDIQTGVRLIDAQSKIDTARQAVGVLQKAIHKYQHHILNYYGIAQEWHEVEEVERGLRSFICQIEDIMVQSLLGAEVLINAFAAGELLYQAS
ncbi:hypothetical protein BKA70DRAFT_1446764 [Coprinopsis sp. MPI-PUGE-AT-0042]|nr:hypothetical protein BKA70DRAFT_1446764 [Coprinopsis sp. MPI-PUGE-AT-0042]